MDIRFIGNSQEKLKKLLDKEHSEEHNNYVALQKKRKEHIEKYTKNRTFGEDFRLLF